jgi:hypothetical protein
VALATSAAAAGALGADTPAEKSPYLGPPLALHAVTNRAFTGIPSMAVSAKGRLWASWYAGITPAEDHNNYVVLSTSGDDGKTWEEVLVADPDEGGPRRTFDPQVWIAPDGALRWSWTDRNAQDYAGQALWMAVIEDPEAATPVWKGPARIATGVMMGKPLVLACGEWALPVATWFTEKSSKMVVSYDEGKTWQIRGGANLPKEHRPYDEHMFVDRQDGSVWLLTRTKYGIAESVSADRGATWPDLQPSAIRHPSARFFISRLASGSLLLVKHGPIAVQTSRSHLTAYVSQDDGKTWKGGLMLDERGGVSYPDGQQTADGLIRIIYDYSRTGDRQILMATFREEDALEGKAVSGDVNLRQIVSDVSDAVKRAPAPQTKSKNTP